MPVISEKRKKNRIVVSYVKSKLRVKKSKLVQEIKENQIILKLYRKLERCMTELYKPYPNYMKDKS